MLKKDLVNEIERLGKDLTVGEVGDNLGLAKHKVYQLIKQYQIPYEKKNPTVCVRRRLTREVFEARVRRNYMGADSWVRQNSVVILPVMCKGKLRDTEFAHQWWKDKIDKAWKRRDVFSGGYTEVVE